MPHDWLVFFYLFYQALAGIMWGGIILLTLRLFGF